MRAAIGWTEQQRSPLLRVALSNGWGAEGPWEPELHLFLLTSSASMLTEAFNKDVCADDKGGALFRFFSLLLPVTLPVTPPVAPLCLYQFLSWECCAD